MKSKFKFETPLIHEPEAAPRSWHIFLYKSILLHWELKLKNKTILTKFNSKKSIGNIKLIRRESIGNLITNLNTSEDIAKDFLCFHSNTSSYSDLFKNLRNCVAHGDYSKGSDGRIYFQHTHSSKPKIFGAVKFSDLKILITELTQYPTRIN